MFKNRGNTSGGNRSFSKPAFGASRPDLHRATCATCGKTCEVPFKPTGSKPVFCRDCFKKPEGPASQSFGNKSYGPSADRELFDAVCANCGNKCKIPFRASPGREVFCSRCFEKQEESNGRPQQRSFDRPAFNRESPQPAMQSMPNYKADFEALSAKMDTILSLLAPKPAKVVKVVEPIAEIKETEEKVEEIVSEKPAPKTKKTTSSKKK